MNRSQFERIQKVMTREFGKMRKSEEDMCIQAVFPMESNALRVHRRYPDSHSRQMRIALLLVLYDLRTRYAGETYDLSDFRNEANERLEHAVLTAFDPFTNPEVRAVLEDSFGTKVDTPEFLKEYYTIPIKGILRTIQSVDQWTKMAGSNGYFEFIEQYMGHMVRGTDMAFSIVVPENMLSDSDVLSSAVHDMLSDLQDN